MIIFAAIVLFLNTLLWAGSAGINANNGEKGAFVVSLILSGTCLVAGILIL